VASPTVPQSAIDRMLDALNATLPDLNLKRARVRRVLAGLLPARSKGSTQLTDREVIYDHAHHGGPTSLVSVSTIKYTTARHAAARAIATATGARRPKSENSLPIDQGEPACPVSLRDGEAALAASNETLARTVDRLQHEEAADTLEDVLYRRTDWAMDPTVAAQLHHRLASMPGHGQDPPDQVDPQPQTNRAASP